MIARDITPTATVLTPRDLFEVRLAGDFPQRCLLLARDAHLDGTARLEAMHERTLDFTVPSKDRSQRTTVWRMRQRF